MASIFGKLFKRHNIIKGPFLFLSIGTENIRGFLFEILILDETRRDFRIKIIKSVLTKRNKDYSKGDSLFNINDLEYSIQKIAVLLKGYLKPVKKIILGISSDIARGEITSLKYKREDPTKKIDQSELKYVIHNMQWRAFEDIRDKFFDQNWLGVKELKIINSEFQETRIDGYQVTDPSGFEGKEIIFSIFNSYVPKETFNFLSGIFKKLELPIYRIYFLPYALTKTLIQKNLSGEGIVIRVSGEITDIFLFREGGIEAISLFTIGGNSFTRRLQKEIGVGFWEAEDIKRKYSDGKLSDTVTKKIEEMLATDLYLWKQALVLALEEFSQTEIFPSKIFLAGGGSLLKGFENCLREKEWRQKLPFLDKIEIKFLNPDESFLLENKEELTAVDAGVDVFSAMELFARQMISKESEVGRLLFKITNMMQE